MENTSWAMNKTWKLVSEGSEKQEGVESVIRNASQRASLARYTRNIGIMTVTVGMIVTVVLQDEAWKRIGGLIGLSFVFIGAGMVIISGYGSRLASKNLYVALEHLEMSQWLDDYEGEGIEEMLDNLRQKKEIEISESGAAYFLQRGDSSVLIAEGRQGVNEWSQDRERVDGMDPRPEIEAVEIEARPSEKIVEEANVKKAEKANEAFLRAEMNDMDLIEAGVKRLGDDIGGSLTLSERP